MVIIGYVVLCLGVLTFFISIKMFLKVQRAKEVFFSQGIGQKEFNFEINSPARYFSISFTGGMSVNTDANFNIRLTDMVGNSIAVSKELMMFRSFYKSKPCVEVYSFKCLPGSYSLVLDAVEGLEVKKSMLRFKQLFQKPINHNNVGLLIRGTLSFKEKLMMMVFLVVGILLINFGSFMVAFNNIQH